MSASRSNKPHPASPDSTSPDSTSPDAANSDDANSDDASSAASPAAATQPWYAEGLRFSCSQCGDCCTGAPGFVWVNKAEIAALAERLEVSVDEFEKLYVRKVGIRKSLKEFSNGDCVFFDTETRGCSVYEQRPRQCRTWPFWDSNLKSRQAWSETCEECPGSGQGRLYSLEEIEDRRGVMKV